MEIILFQCSCFCGLGSCRLCCRWCPKAKESTNTRIAYVFFLVPSFIIMALMISHEVQEDILELVSVLSFYLILQLITILNFIVFYCEMIN